ncbi:NAD(P)-binding protein [Nocardia fluminea]|uniref:NAD(P)-binding protein n=1 Tax=Nocardia fluminea TaxID=134984 RepID=UPI00365F4719
MTEHVVVVGYGATGRSAVELLAADATIELTVIDIALDRAVLAASEGSTAVAGSGLDADLLERVGIVDADRVIVAVGDDEAAVRVTSLVRGLNPTATVCTAIREVGWEPVAVYLGADQAVNVSRLCGVVLGCSVVEPDLPSRIADFSTAGHRSSSENDRHAKANAGTHWRNALRWFLLPGEKVACCGEMAMCSNGCVRRIG